jgi:hypothetical protein
VVDRNDVNSANCVCSFIEPAAFAAWLLRHHQGDKTAQNEAVQALADAIELSQIQRDSVTIGKSPAEFVKLDRPS